MIRAQPVPACGRCGVGCVASLSLQPAVRLAGRFFATRMVKGTSFPASRLNQSSPTGTRSASRSAMRSAAPRSRPGPPPSTAGAPGKAGCGSPGPGGRLGRADLPVGPVHDQLAPPAPPAGRTGRKNRRRPRQVEAGSSRSVPRPDHPHRRQRRPPGPRLARGQMRPRRSARPVIPGRSIAPLAGADPDRNHHPFALASPASCGAGFVTLWRSPLTLALPPGGEGGRPGCGQFQGFRRRAGWSGLRIERVPPGAPEDICAQAKTAGARNGTRVSPAS